jgi:hypothetical protein
MSSPVIMRLSTTVTALLLLGLGADAAPPQVDTRQDPHLGDFRTWGEPCCNNDNQGVYTTTASQSGECFPFTENVGSIMLVDLTPGNSCKPCLQNDICLSGFT